MEYLDILDENGNKTGQTASRADIHSKGYWHKAVHIWFVNSKNEVLLQLRSMEKDNHPGMWDVSVAGHVPAGEDDVTGAIRETQEEIGVNLNPEDFKQIGILIHKSSEKRASFINNEINPVFLVKKDLDITKLKIQKEEVDELRYIPIDEFKNMIDSRNQSLVMHLEEFGLLLKNI